MKESSALVVFRFQIIFTGHNYFHGNVGGGLELISAYVQTFGTIVFEENSAVVGGGITMNDRCLVSIIHRGTTSSVIIMLPSNSFSARALSWSRDIIQEKLCSRIWWCNLC